eukprot:TRINITY_DN2137_c0_g1_i6.p1 TRINITY_DN2137_c0_g1~~TRINITY_DN2137_c0_g1_i6.p1  ORF type:complete len:158 (-),score=24.12 TRINITY_DN2137_c0_g1_i6:68-541(-)
MTQPASSYVVCCLYVHVSWKPEYSIMLCRYQLVSSVRSVSIVVLVVSMLANEISFLFCGGHTVFGFILLKIAKELVERKKGYNFSLNLVSLSTTWEAFWLGSSNPLLVDNYSFLTILSSLLKNKENFQFYSKILTHIKFKQKQKLLTENWKRFTRMF